MPNNQFQEIPSYKALEVVREEDAEDEKPPHFFSENLTESQTSKLSS